MNMKRLLLRYLIAVVVIIVGVRIADAEEWRLPLMVTFVSGFSKLSDQIKENLEYDYYGTVEEIGGLPVGLSFHPYYEYDSGLGIGGGVGPVMMIAGEAFVYNIPVNASVRYSFTPQSKSTAYIRIGGGYHYAGGDYIEGSGVGFIGAIGMELMRDRAVGIGIEVGYDNGFIKVQDLEEDEIVEIRPNTLMLSVGAIF
jgi:hypothetical protein